MKTMKTLSRLQWAALAALPPLAIACALDVARGPDESAVIQAVFNVDNLVASGYVQASEYRHGFVQAGVLGTSTQIDNWSPTGLATKAIIMFTGGDNNSTLITGIDAVGASIPIGTRRTFCAANGTADSGAVAFSVEDTNSVAGNRVWTPLYGQNLGQATTERYTLGPSACVDMVYVNPIQADLVTKRWMIVDNERMSSASIKQLGFYPYAQPVAITGTVNNWNPQACSTPTGGSCEAGANPSQLAYTTIVISTVDATGATITGLEYGVSTDTVPEGNGPVKLLFNFGPGPVTLPNQAGASAALNQFYFSIGGDNRADVVLNEGDSVLLWHPRNTGKWQQIAKSDYFFDARDVSMTKGLAVTGVYPGSNPAAVFVSQVFASRTTGYLGVDSDVSGTMDTTAGNLDVFGIIGNVRTSRVAGGFNVVNVGLYGNAQNGQGNYGLQTGRGDVYQGLGFQMANWYANSANSDFSGPVDSQGNFRVGISDFGGAEKFQVFAGNGHLRTTGTAPADGADCDGAGAATVTGTDTSFKVTTGAGAVACTVTFASTFTNPPTCTVFPEGGIGLPTCTISATAITCTVATVGTYNWTCVGPPGST